MSEWKNDPWYIRSEEFYRMVYKGGSCRFCHKSINTPLDICDCKGMRIAREKFKKAIGINPQAKIDYNPDRFTEPETIEDVPF